MPSYQGPVSYTSTRDIITVTGSSELSINAGLTASNGFRNFVQPSLYTRVAHPQAAFAPLDFEDCNPTEDGANYESHPMIDYSGKWCYDTVGGKGMWLGNGANPAQGTPVGNGTRDYSHLWNTFAIYDEVTNTWSTERSVKCPDEGADPDCTVHIYDSNCIDVAGRRFFKKKFREARVMVRNLATGQWINTIPTPANEAGYARMGAMDVVPVRGASGALWLFSWASSNNSGRLWEHQFGGAGFSTLIDTGPFGGDNPGTPCMSFNPRAFSGAGGVMIGSAQGCWTVRCDTLAVTSVGVPASANMQGPHGTKLCKDPVGVGWLYMHQNGFMYRWDGSSWAQRAQLPATLGVNGNGCPAIPCAIDTLGVVWIVASQLVSGAAGNNINAWLYRP